MATHLHTCAALVVLAGVPCWGFTVGAAAQAGCGAPHVVEGGEDMRIRLDECEQLNSSQDRTGQVADEAACQHCVRHV